MTPTERSEQVSETNHPTARERFEEIKQEEAKNRAEAGYSLDDKDIDFLFSLVEAAVAIGVENSEHHAFTSELWDELNQRMAVREDANREGEGKK